MMIDSWVTNLASWGIAVSLEAGLAILLVLLLRKPLARYCGPGFAYALWCLPVLTIVLPELSWSTTQGSLVGQPYFVLATLQSTPSESALGPAWQYWLVPIWWGGAWLALATTLLRHMRWHGRVHRQSSTVSGALAARCEAVAKRFGLPCRVRLSAQVKGPLVIGMLRPCIYLPMDFARLIDARVQDLVLAHEFCHIARRDLWLNWLAHLLRCCFWFNPLVYLAHDRFRQDQEWSCDARVLAEQSAATRHRYAAALLQVAIHRSPLVALHLNHNANRMKERIQMLKRHRFYPTGGKLIVTIGLLVSLSFGVSLAGADAEPPAKNGSPPKIHVEAPIYPKFALEQGLGGYVYGHIIVADDGTVTDFEVYESEPPGVFDQAIIDAALKNLYEPGHAGAYKMLVEFNLSPEESDESENL